MKRRNQLRKSQLKGYHMIMEHPATMLAMQMACGKTVTALTAIRDLLDTFQVRNVLIIAPLLVAEEVWPDEIEDWEHTCVLDYEVLTGVPERRENRAKRLAEVSIVNVENVTWLVDFWGDDWPYDMIIIDEASKFKNHTRRTKPTKKKIDQVTEKVLGSLPKDMNPVDAALEVKKAIKRIPCNPTRFGALCSVRKHAQRVVLMGGTPAPNGLLDLWSQYYLLDLGERLESSFHKYRNRYFESDYMGYKYTLRPGCFERISERISDITISMKTEDWSDMPPLINNVIRVRLPPKVMAQYRKFEKSLYLEDYDIEAVNNGVLTGKLLQLCIAKGTEVLCRRGWVPIELVTNQDLVWDGIEFVSTKGVKFNGMSDVVTCFGVDMTSDHKVLTETGWRTAGEVLSADADKGFNRATVRIPDGFVPGGQCRQQGFNVALPVCLRQGSGQVEYITSEQTEGPQEVMWVSPRGNVTGRMGHPWNDWATPLGDMAGYEKALPEPGLPRLPQLRWPWDRHGPSLGYQFFKLLGRYVRRVPGRPNPGPSGQFPGVQQVELPLGEHEGSDAKHASESPHPYSVGIHNGSRGGRAFRFEANNNPRPSESRLAGGTGAGPHCRAVPVFDLIDCGPRNRFVVRGEDGPLIVHNCNGAVYDEDGNVHEIHSLKLDALDRVIEEAAGAPVLVAYSFQFDLEKLRKRYPQAEVAGEAKNLQKRWNNGEIPILLAHPASAGHGLNLQHGGCITVWYGLTWSLELYQQLNKRLHRPGQKETVIIHHIICADTKDEDVMEVLPKKDALQEMLIEATRYRPGDN